MLDPQHVAWCRRFFSLLKDGAIWGIPRNGLLYRKQGSALVLYDAAPWEPGMPMDEHELADYQQAEHEQTKAYFEAAGIEVRDER